mmetsp:Transcript_53232/g.115596  ORF Transcript_53232/g.115596 Transcript_53232/m.115596 type:complete len:222 (-) Transcript_53232:89-754(-)
MNILLTKWLQSLDTRVPVSRPRHCLPHGTCSLCCLLHHSRLRPQSFETGRNHFTQVVPCNNTTIGGSQEHEAKSGDSEIEYRVSREERVKSIRQMNESVFSRCRSHFHGDGPNGDEEQVEDAQAKRQKGFPLWCRREHHLRFLPIFLVVIAVCDGNARQRREQEHKATLVVGASDPTQMGHDRRHMGVGGVVPLGLLWEHGEGFHLLPRHSTMAPRDKPRS